MSKTDLSGVFALASVTSAGLSSARERRLNSAIAVEREAKLAALEKCASLQEDIERYRHLLTLRSDIDPKWREYQLRSVAFMETAPVWGLSRNAFGTSRATISSGVLFFLTVGKALFRMLAYMEACERGLLVFGDQGMRVGRILKKQCLVDAIKPAVEALSRCTYIWVAPGSRASARAKLNTVATIPMRLNSTIDLYGVPLSSSGAKFETFDAFLADHANVSPNTMPVVGRRLHPSYISGHPLTAGHGESEYLYCSPEYLHWVELVWSIAAKAREARGLPALTEHSDLVSALAGLSWAEVESLLSDRARSVLDHFGCQSPDEVVYSALFDPAHANRVVGISFAHGNNGDARTDGVLADFVDAFKADLLSKRSKLSPVELAPLAPLSMLDEIQ